jgi:hypothetical protein
VGVGVAVGVGVGVIVAVDVGVGVGVGVTGATVGDGVSSGVDVSSFEERTPTHPASATSKQIPTKIERCFI